MSLNDVAQDRCEVCGGRALRPLPGPQTRWRYTRCDQCGHASLCPQPSQAELAAYYNSTYGVPLDRYLSAVRREWPIMRQLIGPARGRMLEVGCAYGAMLDACRADGWKVRGIELDARSAAYARATYGLDVREGTLEALDDWGDWHADVVTAYHVIEHVTDPAAFLRAAARVMRPGSRLLLKTPNGGGLPAIVGAGWWEWFSAPAHVHVFTPRSLSMALEQAGFSVQVLRTRRGDALGSAFEMTRAGTRRMLGLPAPVEDGQPPPPDARPPLRSHRWYHAARAAIELAGRPLDAALAAVGARVPGGPELLVVAMRR